MALRYYTPIDESDGTRSLASPETEETSTPELGTGVTVFLDLDKLTVEPGVYQGADGSEMIIEFGEGKCRSCEDKLPRHANRLRPFWEDVF